MITDQFIEAASVPVKGWHTSGTLDEANAILAEHPSIHTTSIYAAAVLGEGETVKSFLETDPLLATQKGGPHNWDALTYLCFSKYLRLDTNRSEKFLHAAKLLLDAGADVSSGWWETHHMPQPEWESVLYGASGIAHHPGITQLLLDGGADPNDNETVYHTPESYDNRCMKILLDTGKLSDEHTILMLIRKHDIHDYAGVKMILETGIDPNLRWKPGFTPLLHAIARDNSADTIQLLLEHGANPLLNNENGTALSLAARRGRKDLLEIFEKFGFSTQLQGVDKLIAACAKDDPQTIQAVIAHEPQLVKELLAIGGKLLAEFAGTNNAAGIRNLLSLGVPVDALYNGDDYFEIPPLSTALHVATWKAHYDALLCLIENGANINAKDGKGRTPLMLAIRATIHSYWMNRRNTKSIEALLQAGATTKGITIPIGYPEADLILEKYMQA